MIRHILTQKRQWLSFFDVEIRQPKNTKDNEDLFVDVAPLEIRLENKGKTVGVDRNRSVTVLKDQGCT